MLKYTDYDIVFQEIPSEVTLAINLSNCPHRCKGCHSPQLRLDIGEELTEVSLRQIIEEYRQMITCVCFMGGDASPQDVVGLATFIKENYTLKTGWYSGNDTIFNNQCKKIFDYIKLGEYKPEFGPLNSITTNQRLYQVSCERLKDITFRMHRDVVFSL